MIALAAGAAINPTRIRIKPNAHQLLERGVYNPTPEETAIDVSNLYDALCDLLLPAFMSDKPYTVGRARIEAALNDKTYIDKPLVHRIIQIASRKESPYEYLRKLHTKLEATKASALINAQRIDNE